VDKTVSYVQQPKGGIKRLHVAVVVNNLPVTDAKGKVTYRPLNDAEKQQINDLAMQAMGFNKERGDSITVVNSSFAGEPVEVLPEVPVWQNPVAVEYGKDGLRFLVGIVVLFLVYTRMLKPLLAKLSSPMNNQKMLGQADQNGEDAIVNISGQPTMSLTAPGYEQNLGVVKQLAKDNPRMVANVVSNWTNGSEK
jgi:flagellar M-ring protein FliF